jgi:hypothetical protein
MAIIGALVLVATFRPAFAQNFRLVNAANGAQRAPEEWGPLVHWDLREMPGCAVPWTRGTAPTPDLDGNPFNNDQDIAQSIFVDAFKKWDDVTPSKLGFLNIFIGIPIGGFVADEWNTISFSATALPNTVNAQTMVVFSASTGVISEADIVLNSKAIPFIVGGLIRLGPRHWVTKADGATCDADFDLPPFGNWPTPADGDTEDVHAAPPTTSTWWRRRCARRSPFRRGWSCRASSRRG